MRRLAECGAVGAMEWREGAPFPVLAHRSSQAAGTALAGGQRERLENIGGVPMAAELVKECGS